MKIQFDNSYYTNVAHSYAYSEEATLDDVNYYYQGVCMAIDHLEKTMSDGANEEEMLDILRAHKLLKEELYNLLYRLEHDFK